jgi:ATP-dependent DNA helicase RecG
MPVTLTSEVQYLKGVGPRRAKMLADAGIKTAGDLLRYLPMRYEDRTRFMQIRDLQEDQEAVIETTVLVTGDYSTRRRNFNIFELIVRDESGSISIKFFNQTYLARVFERGQKVIFFGVPRYDKYSQALVLLNPEFEIGGSGGDQAIHTGRIVPIYRRIGQLTTRVIRLIMFNLLENLPAEIPDQFPESIKKRRNLPELAETYRQVHFPSADPGIPAETLIAGLEAHTTRHYQRLVFEEFFLFQLGILALQSQRDEAEKTHQIQVNDPIRGRLKTMLPFSLTQAQKRVLREIAEDLMSSRPMSRLLQGDVGSGKTIVALLSMALVIENGFQTCLMAPTELLAEQHFRGISSFTGELPYRIGLLTSSTKGLRRKDLLAKLKAGEIDLLVGTHAIIEEGVEFKSLAFVVIDEQHRFGVLQRSRLMEKGEHPDTLVMTATPIPRSLALTVYGDLRVSVLDQLPPGRRPVKTVIKAEQSRDEVYDLIRRSAEQGRQVFIVYPLVEESEKSDLKAATEMAETLSREVFPDLRIGLMHGRLKGAVKDQLMAEFLEGKLQILVSTTVIEVGIDVPNASLMVIEHAERFGLSQLHQLRGRIGRGRHDSICVLMVDRVSTPEAFERLQVMRRSSDGFVIAEKDLEIRGPGEFVGTRQSGVPEFVFGNILRDRKLLELARQEAERYLKEVLGTSRSPGRTLQQILTEWRERYHLAEVG